MCSERVALDPQFHNHTYLHHSTRSVRHAGSGAIVSFHESNFSLSVLPSIW
jgi:hypothetical protein